MDKFEFNRDIKTGYDNSGGQTGLSLDATNSVEIPVPFHPDRMVEAPSTMPKGPIAAVETFAARIAASIDSDYGDWMREANIAWLELNAVLSTNATPSIENKMALMHDFIQFNPSWKPIETCRAAMIVARDIHRELGAHADLDLHRFGIGWTEPETAEVELEEASPYPNHLNPHDKRASPSTTNRSPGPRNA